MTPTAWHAVPPPVAAALVSVGLGSPLCGRVTGAPQPAANECRICAIVPIPDKTVLVCKICVTGWLVRHWACNWVFWALCTYVLGSDVCVPSQCTVLGARLVAVAPVRKRMCIQP